MNLFSRAPSSAIGISVDGLSVKAAHLRKEGGRVVLAGVEATQLKARFEAGGSDERTSAAPSAEDILGLAPTPNATTPAPAAQEEAEEETNSSVLYGLLNKFPVAESVLAIGLMETSVALFDLKGLKDVRGKQLRRQVIEKVAAARGGTPPAEDRIDFIQTGKGGVFALAHEDPLELLGLLDQLRPFYGRLQVGLIDANEVSLINLVRRSEPGDAQVSAVIYVGEDFSRAIFLSGGDYLSMTQVISEGVRSPQVLNTLFSRILLEQDTSHLPEIERVFLAGGARAVDAQAFFAAQFPDAQVDYLTPAGLDVGPINAQSRDRIPEFDIPIGLAWKALEPRHPLFHPTNFLSRERKRMQNPLEIAWHGLAMIALIAATALLMGMRLWDQSRSIAAVRRSNQLKEQEIRENNVYVGVVDSLQNQIAWYRRSLSLTDTLSSHYRAWSPLLRSLTEGTRQVNSLWFTGLTAEKGRVVLTGRSLYRDRIPAIAKLLGGSVVRKITRSQARSREVYDFEIEVQSFTSLAQDTLAVASNASPDGPSGTDREAEAVADKAEGTPEQAAPAKDVRGGVRYIIHVGVFEDRAAADRRVARLSEKGYPAWVSEGETRWGRFLAHAGPFNTPQEARQVRDRLKQEEGLDAWIYKRQGD